MAEPARPPTAAPADITDDELKARVQARFDKVVSKMGPKSEETPGYGTMMSGMATGVPGDMNPDKGPSDAARLAGQAHTDIGSDGGQENAGPPLAPPRVVSTPGGMMPSTESGTVVSEAAPAWAQQEYRAKSGAALEDKKTAAGLEANEAAYQHDQQAEIQKQNQEYMDVAHQKTLEVAKRQAALTDRYEEMMGSLEAEIASIPNAPRTIREKLEQSGVGDRIAFGFAAALSVLGSGRNGGQSAQNFINNVRTSIDALVMKEKETYDRLGDKAKRFDNVYEKAYKALGDQSAALEVTRKLYMEAADAAIKEQAQRYQAALTGPSTMKAMAEWDLVKSEADLKASGTVKQAAEKTMKYVPPTSKVIYDPRDPRSFLGSLKPKDLEQVQQYRKYLDEGGVPQLSGAIKALERVIPLMPEGFDLGLFINGKMPVGTLNTALSAFDGKKQQLIKQELQHASNLLSREANGQSKTANEIILSGIQTGLHNKQGAQTTLGNLKARARATTHAADTTFRLSNGASAGDAYRALESATPVQE